MRLLRTLVIFAIAVPARGAIISWNNPAGGNWNTASNWNPAAVPGAADHAIISLAGTYTVALDTNATLMNFTLNSPNVTFSANGRTMSVSGSSILTAGTLVWVNSTWTGAGPLTNNATVTGNP